MSDLTSWLSEILHISPFYTEKIFLSIISIVIMLIVRSIVLGVLGNRVENIKDKYFWIRATKYLVGTLIILILIVIWASEFAAFGTVVGLFSAGLAIALKDPLVNIAGWLFIIMRRPFRVGDRIQIGQLRGDVIDIRIFQFTLNEIGNWVDADQSTGRIIHVPNGKVFLESQANYSQGFSHIWNELRVLITFESNWRAAKFILEEIINNQAGSLTKAAQKKLAEASKQYMIFYNRLTPIVYTAVKDSGIQFSVRYLVTPHRRRTSEEAIWESILAAFSKHDDIEFAYPTTRIYYKESNPSAASMPGKELL
jgi:small-conductance mechanosensitive channel